MRFVILFAGLCGLCASVGFSLAQKSPEHFTDGAKLRANHPFVKGHR